KRFRERHGRVGRALPVRRCEEVRLRARALRLRHARIREREDGSHPRRRRWAHRRHYGIGVSAWATARSAIVTVAPRRPSVGSALGLGGVPAPPPPSTSCRLIARPSPLPLVRVEKWGSKIRGSTSGAIP